MNYYIVFGGEGDRTLIGPFPSRKSAQSHPTIEDTDKIVNQRQAAKIAIECLTDSPEDDIRLFNDYS